MMAGTFLWRNLTQAATKISWCSRILSVIHFSKFKYSRLNTCKYFSFKNMIWGSKLWLSTFIHLLVCNTNYLDDTTARSMTNWKGWALSMRLSAFRSCAMSRIRAKRDCSLSPSWPAYKIFERRTFCKNKISVRDRESVLAVRSSTLDFRHYRLGRSIFYDKWSIFFLRFWRFKTGINIFIFIFLS